ncbi:MAG: TIGR02996 domain-containing protein [Kofleriaceae bacterium]
MTTQADLEAAIDRDPDSAEAYLVYADVLQSQGDPLGELIVLQHQGRSTDLVESKGMLGTFAGFVERDSGRRKQRKFALTWQYGFIRTAHIGWESRGSREDSAAELRAFLELPVARFLQELVLGPAPASDFMGFGHLLDVIAELGKPLALRKLVVGDIGHWDISSTAAGLFAPAVAALPYLRSLVAHAGDISLGHLVHTELRELAIQTGGIGTDVLEQLCRSELPKLERLELWFGTPNYGGTTEVGDIAPILDGHFPNLTHLGLMNAVFTDAIAASLATSKILPRLKTLDLSMGTLSDAGVRAMVETRGAFAHLEHLELDDNALDETKVLAATLAKQVHVGDTHEPDRVEGDFDDRYTSVGE